MSDDETAGPSFLLAQHDTAHREHPRTETRTATDTHTDTRTHLPSHTHTFAHARQKESRHQHHRLHEKRDPAVTEVVEEVTTQIVTTISIIEEIDVDQNGNTITVHTRLANSSDFPWLATLTEPFSPGATGTSITPADSQIPPSVPATSSTSWQTVVPLSASTPLITPRPFSFPPSSNSTILTSTFHNSTITSSASRSSLRSSSSRSSSSTGSYSTTALSTSTFTDVPTSLAPFGGVNTDVGGSEPSSTPVSAGGGNQTETTPTPVVIGGVVGSVAGAAIIIVALLFILRWRKRGGQMLSSGVGGTGGAGGGNDTIEGPSSQPPGAMTERRSLGFALPAALAGLTGNKRQSQKTERTVSSTAGSERGFYRVSGRKLPSVLQSGGDGYGGETPNEQTLSGSSFYRDSQGYYGGPGGPASPPPGVSVHPEGGLPTIRPSPARTPVTEHGPFADIFQTPPQPPPPPRPDGLGRSHPSQDGSHTSRFTEEV